MALTERLKANSRSKHRGGLHELTTLGGTARLKTRGKKVGDPAVQALPQKGLLGHASAYYATVVATVSLHLSQRQYSTRFSGISCLRLKFV